MNKFVNQNRKIILVFIDTLSIVFSFLLSFLLRFDFQIPAIFFFELIYLLPVLILLQIIVFNFSGFYNVIWRFTSFWDMVNIIKGITISNLISFGILGFIKGSTGYPRSILLMFFVLNILMICLTRILARLYHTHYQSNPIKMNFNKKRLILIGAGRTGEKITREIKGTNDTPYELVGLVDDDLSIQKSTIHGVKVLGTISDLPKLKIEVGVTDELVDQVIEEIQKSANTGQIGDGKIFVLDLQAAIRIRTGDTGSDAL